MSPFGLYVHVPFCAARCGYCDFNTYTAAELPGGGDRAGFAVAALQELDQARAALGEREVTTVFFGGGTPTLLPPEDLVAILDGVRERFGLAPGAEVTTEANPESVDPRTFAVLREGGFTRVSVGMQHAAPHVLQVLDRVHTPGRAGAAVAEARAAGFEHVSLDLIYGTPGERAEDWALTLETALAAGPDHVSAYGLEVEPGTALAARVRRGELPMPEGDAMADRQAEADAAFSAAGLAWYEVANHAASPASRCRHNLGYWHSHDWWGIGPGAHSHLDGTRWWNVKHPSAYARKLAAGDSPMAGSEELTPDVRRFERIMLEVRLAEGLDLALLSPAGRAAADRLAADGALELADGRARLTLHGRLTADAVVRDLTD
ncbi:MAG: oxygen-independent coproporphyrinogen oxidase [Solirubrobacterales bacterium]|nr:oxygen-independent coproporphyrinogen oxidase [Solirubrobacterales bacterium]